MMSGAVIASETIRYFSDPNNLTQDQILRTLFDHESEGELRAQFDDAAGR